MWKGQIDEITAELEHNKRQEIIRLIMYDSSTNVGDKLLEKAKSICDVESKSLEVATTCSSQTLGLDSLTRTVSIDNVQDLIGKSEDTMNQIAAHAQTCATLRMRLHTTSTRCRHWTRVLAPCSGSLSAKAMLTFGTCLRKKNQS